MEAADDLPIVTFCAVCPTLTAEIVSDDMARFAAQIGRGALASLLATKNRDYTDKAGAVDYARQWLDDIAEARSHALKGFSRSYPRTRASWF